MADLPFEVTARIAERGSAIFMASVDGKRITSERYTPGDGDKRRKVAKRWANDARLRNGSAVPVDAVAGALEAAELEALRVADEIADESGEAPAMVERAGYVDGETIAELAWNPETGGPDFILFERATGQTSRADHFDGTTGMIVIPGICQDIVTPGHPIEGAVSVPTICDGSDGNEAQLRADIESFVNRYVELPADAVSVAVEYVLLTWVYDAFDELPYLAFRTADCGRGKSRALETVGALCYRPLFVGGGSSAAATLRMVDAFRGTLVADEFDQRRDTDLATAIAQILNQGFQRNRPLIKCDGERNEPRSFTAFGPKLFALRTRLGDDATESRTISIRMSQRTRDNIPLNLPRERFDRQALALRNRLLAFRFANLGRVVIDPALASPELEDRANQIALPLLAIARSDAVRDRIIAALKDQQGQTAADRSDSLAGEIFGAIQSIADPGSIVRPKAVTAEVNQRRAEAAGIGVDDLGKRGTRAVTVHKVAKVMRTELELPREPKDAEGAKYRLDPARMKQLATRFGVALGETSRTSLSSFVIETSLENPRSEGVSGDYDISDDSDVSNGVRGVAEQQTSFIAGTATCDGESAVERAERYRAECGGFPPGTTPA